MAPKVMLKIIYAGPLSVSHDANTAKNDTAIDVAVPRGVFVVALYDRPVAPPRPPLLHQSHPTKTALTFSWSLLLCHS